MDNLSSGYTVSSGICFPYVNVVSIFSVSLTWNLMAFMYFYAYESNVLETELTDMLIA